MAKWAFLFCVLLCWESGFAQRPAADRRRSGMGVRRPAADTVAFSFDLLDWHRGDTVYLHAIRPETAAPAIDWTIRAYFQKRIRGIYHLDTIITGKLELYFIADMNGKIVRSGYDPTIIEASNDRELADEVLHVLGLLNRVKQMAPTTIAGRPVVSIVRMRVVFKAYGEAYGDDYHADLIIENDPVMY